jgi:hypothetical protein
MESGKKCAKIEATINAKGKLIVRKSEKFLNANVTVISEGYVVVDGGSYFVNYTSPVQYQHPFNCVRVDLEESYMVCYTNNECSAYGRQDTGSKFEFFDLYEGGLID